MLTAPASADYERRIAAHLSGNPDAIVMNVPSRPQSYPGAVFRKDMSMPIIRGRADDPGLARGSLTQLSIQEDFNLQAGVGFGVKKFFGFAADAKDIALIKLNFSDVRIVDIEYSELMKRLQENKFVQNEIKKGTLPIVIYKSYEGKTSYTIIKKSGASVEAWAKLKKNIGRVEIDVEFDSSEKIIVKSDIIDVFAFETMVIGRDFANSTQENIIIKSEINPSFVFSDREKIFDFESPSRFERARSLLSNSDSQSATLATYRNAAAQFMAESPSGYADALSYSLVDDRQMISMANWASEDAIAFQMISPISQLPLKRREIAYSYLKNEITDKELSDRDKPIFEFMNRNRPLVPKVAEWISKDFGPIFKMDSLRSLNPIAFQSLFDLASTKGNMNAFLASRVVSNSPALWSYEQSVGRSVSDFQ